MTTRPPIQGWRAIQQGDVVHVIPVDGPDATECVLCREGACHRRVEREPGSLDLVVHEGSGET